MKNLKILALVLASALLSISFVSCIDTNMAIPVHDKGGTGALNGEAPKEVLPIEPAEPKEDGGGLLTLEEELYLDTMYYHAVDVAGCFDDMANLFFFGDIDSEEWMIELAMVLATLDTLIEEARDWDVPDRFEELNGKYLEAMQEMEKAIPLIIEGVDTLDETKIQKASHHIENVSILIDEAKDILDQFL